MKTKNGKGTKNRPNHSIPGLRVNLKTGYWSISTTGEKGDMISLWQRIRRVESAAEAAVQMLVEVGHAEPRDFPESPGIQIHERTSKLRALVARYKWSMATAARILAVDEKTVRRWWAGSASVISARALDVLSVVRVADEDEKVFDPE